MSTPPEVRVGKMMGDLWTLALRLGDSPVYVQDEEGKEFSLVDITTANGDVWLIVHPIGGYDDE